MKAPLKDVKKLAQAYLGSKGFYSGDIDGLWGKGSNAAYTEYSSYLASRGLALGEEERVVEEPTVEQSIGVVVIDPGHGGRKKTGGSSPNNATSVSGVLEKTMTLELAKLVRTRLKAIAKETPGSSIDVHLTRARDANLGLTDRARLAGTKHADVFVSLHFNGFNGRARGTETWVLSERNGNMKPAADRALAERVQSTLVRALRSHDPAARDRGVKDTQKLGVLRSIQLGNSRHEHFTRACLIEVEFIDVDAVDELLNTGPGARAIRTDVASAIADAIVQDLQAHA